MTIKEVQDSVKKSWIENENLRSLYIRTEFAKEGMPVKKLEISNGKIEIDAEYSK